MRLKDLKIGTRLGLGFGGVLLVMAAVGGAGYRGVASLQKTADHMLEGDAAVAQHAARARAHILGLRRFEKDTFLNIAVPEKVEKYLQEWSQEREQLAERIADLEKVATEEAAKKQIGLIKANALAYAAGAEKVFAEVRNGTLKTPAEGNAAIGAYKEASHAMEAEASALSAESFKLMDQERSVIDEEVHRTILSIVLFSLGSAIIGIAAAFLVTRSIRKPIGEALAVSQRLAEGDLLVRVEATGRDETGQLLDATATMVGKLREVVVGVMTTAQNVASGSQELSSSSQQMSHGASEQASSVEEVSSSMEQMASNIRQNADNAEQTEKMALRSSAAAREGGQAVSETVTAMKDIAGKISIIEEIARQTNLLALNAAIEAARAGEHGKGFAVVASEVRKLAERSQKAAGEINQLSQSSVSVAEHAGELLKGMVPEIQKTAELVQEITAACREQDAGAAQINKAIQQLDQVIQQNASAAEEMASTSEELSSQAEALQSAVEFFKIEGTAHPTRPARPALHAPVKNRGGNRVAVGKNVSSRPTGRLAALEGSVNEAGAELHLDPAESVDADYERY